MAENKLGEDKLPLSYLAIKNKTIDKITLETDIGAVDFTVVAGIDHNGEHYAILQPVELLPGMEEDDAFVLKVSFHNEKSDKYEFVLDEKIIDAVFNKYDEMYDKEMNESQSMSEEEEKKNGRK